MARRGYWNKPLHWLAIELVETVIDKSAVEQLLDVGFSAVTLIMLYLVWRRLSDLTDKIIDILMKLSEAALQEESTTTTKL